MASSVQRQRRRDFWIECVVGVLFFFSLVALYGLVDRLSGGMP